MDDLVFDDLKKINWAGSATHLKYVEEALNRAQKGEVIYLAVRDADGNPISIGGVDFCAHENAGTLWQIITKDSLRGLGIGTKLIESLEQKIKSRGINIVMLGVEDNNIIAQNLYKKLGYEVCGEAKESWKEEDESGRVYTHYADEILMKKQL